MQDELQQEHSVNSELKEQVKNLDSKLKCILSELKEVNHSNCTFKQQVLRIPNLGLVWRLIWVVVNNPTFGGGEPPPDRIYSMCTYRLQ